MRADNCAYRQLRVGQLRADNCAHKHVHREDTGLIINKQTISSIFYLLDYELISHLTVNL